MRERLRDYAILLAISAVLTLPNLGATSLWDVDEGVNAEAAREMYDNGSWLVPTFNYQLRTAKPVMLYWLQRVAYTVFGVNEWSARLPSVLAAWLTVLLTYELARRMFGRATGLLAGVVLASAFEFCMLAHAATPDATLLLFTVLTYFLFWTRHRSSVVGRCEAGRAEGSQMAGLGSQTPATAELPSRKWWVPTAAACGLAVLTKGPVGVALPGLVIVLYFAWNRELGRLLDRKLLVASLVFVLVAGPWYGLVTAETRGEWARVFFGRENLGRFTTPMENHRGPFIYHAVALLVLFAPWSVFLVAAVWEGVRGACGWTNRDRKGAGEPHPLPCGRGSPEVRAFRFLICWFAVYLVFFSAAATKLPNYILPVYPAIAILTARFLVRWQAGDLTLPRWLLPTSVAGLVLTGVAVVGGLLVVGDAVHVLPANARVFPGMARWALIGIIPLIAAVGMTLALRTGDRARFVRAMAIGAVAFVALAAAFPPLAVDSQKAPRELVRTSGVSDPSRDLRLAHFDWFQPSVVFYAQREVVEMKSPDMAANFFSVPTPGYLFIPTKTWEQLLEAKVTVPTRIVARHYDFYRNCEILVVTNDVTATAAR